MALVVALDENAIAVGGNAAALAMLAAWAMRDILGRRAGREDDADLLGVLAIAVLLVLLPLATDGGQLARRARRRRSSASSWASAWRACAEHGRAPRLHRRRGRGGHRGARRPRAAGGGAAAWSAPTRPGIQRILNEALQAADWFGSAHQAAVLEAAGKPDVDERLTAVRTLIAEETSVSMLIGVAVGYELAHELMRQED